MCLIGSDVDSAVYLKDSTHMHSNPTPSSFYIFQHAVKLVLATGQWFQQLSNTVTEKGKTQADVAAQPQSRMLCQDIKKAMLKQMPVKINWNSAVKNNAVKNDAVKNDDVKKFQGIVAKGASPSY